MMPQDRSMLIRPFLLLMSAILVAGCAGAIKAEGPAFKSISSFPNNEALVYIYKAKGYGGDIFEIRLDGEPITVLKTGGYFPTTVEPGSHEITALMRPRGGNFLIPALGLEPTMHLTLSAAPGQIFYVKLHGKIRLKLSQFSYNEAWPELQQCKLLPGFSED